LPVDERKLRAFLRQEAANTQIPGDMWQQVSSRLDIGQKRPRRLTLRGLIAPAIGLCAAAAVFWLTLIPAVDDDARVYNPTVFDGSRSTRASVVPTLSVSYQVAPVRYELGPETTLALVNSAPPDINWRRLGGVTQ